MTITISGCGRYFRQEVPPNRPETVSGKSKRRFSTKQNDKKQYQDIHHPFYFSRFRRHSCSRLIEGSSTKTAGAEISLVKIESPNPVLFNDKKKIKNSRKPKAQARNA